MFLELVHLAHRGVGASYLVLWLPKSHPSTGHTSRATYLKDVGNGYVGQKLCRFAYLRFLLVVTVDNTRRARVAPKGLLCRVLTNHPAERQDT